MSNSKSGAKSKLPGFLIDSPELVPHAIAIRAIGKQTIDNVIEIGGRLTECKRIIKHGGFGDWLKREFNWTDRLARAFMQVFEMSKTENFSDLNLPVSSLYLLAAPSTPKKVRKEVIARASKGEKMKGSDVKRAVKAAKKPKTAAANSAAPGVALTASAETAVVALQVMPGDVGPMLDESAQVEKPHRARPKSKELRDREIAIQVNAMSGIMSKDNEIQRLQKVVIGLESEIETLKKENADLKVKLAAWQTATGVDAPLDPTTWAEH